jgi:hypothetical protein
MGIGNGTRCLLNSPLLSEIQHASRNNVLLLRTIGPAQSGLHSSGGLTSDVIVKLLTHPVAG